MDLHRRLLLGCGDVRDAVVSDEGFADLASEMLGRGHSLRFRAYGRSMRPGIRDGDVLTAEPVGPKGLRLGAIALHRTSEGRAVAHRVIARRTHQGTPVLITCGDSSPRSIARVSEEQVLGRVVTAQRGEKLIHLDRGTRRLVGLLWVAVSLARYVTLRVTDSLRRRLSAFGKAVAEDRAPVEAAASSSPDDGADVGRALIGVCGSFACGKEWPVPPEFAPCNWQRLAELARHHGLTPVLYRLLGETDEVPREVRDGLRNDYVVQTARSLRAVQQVREVSQALGSTGLGVIALKGASSLLQLHEDVGCRPMIDIDLMVRRESVEQLVQLLGSIGYCCPTAPSSPESMWVSAEMGYRFPFERQGYLPLDVHTDVLDIRDPEGLAPGEMWSQARPIAPGEALLALAPSHFLLHSATHYMKHRDFDVAALSWMLEVLIATRRWTAEIDWSEFWQTASRWGIAGDAATVMATLSLHWGLRVPLLPSGASPLSARDLLSTEGVANDRRAAADLSRQFRRVVRLRHLPTVKARLHYLRFLLFPPVAVLRYRYSIPKDKAAGPYYVRHLLTLAGRFFKGVAAALRRPSR